MTEQLDLGGMPKRLFTATPSRLSTWANCPRRYWFTYVARGVTKSGPWAHNSVGLSAHNALRDWMLREPEDRTREAAEKLVDQDWLGLGFRDRQQELDWLERSRGWVGDYVDTLDPDFEPVGVERTVATKTEGLALSGRVDRIDQAVDSDEIIIVDYKTTRFISTVDEARSSMPLAVYAVAAQRTMHRPCHQVELHHLPSGERAVWRHDDASLAKQVERAQWIADDIQDALSTVQGDDHDAGSGVPEAFEARVGPLCAYCDVHDSCAEGSAHIDGAKPWAILERIEQTDFEPPPDSAPPDEVG